MEREVGEVSSTGKVLERSWRVRRGWEVEDPRPVHEGRKE